MRKAFFLLGLVVVVGPVCVAEFYALRWFFTPLEGREMASATAVCAVGAGLVFATLMQIIRWQQR